MYNLRTLVRILVTACAMKLSEKCIQHVKLQTMVYLGNLIWDQQFHRPWLSKHFMIGFVSRVTPKKTLYIFLLDPSSFLELFLSM